MVQTPREQSQKFPAYEQLTDEEKSNYLRGQNAIDIYTLVHFGIGFLATFWLAIPIVLAILLQVAFEIWENTPSFYRLWNKLESSGYYGDTVANSNCDTAAFILGAALGVALRERLDREKKGKRA